MLVGPRIAFKREIMAASSKMISEYTKKYPTNLALHLLLIASLSPMQKDIFNYIFDQDVATSFTIQNDLFPDSPLSSICNELKKLQEYGLITADDNIGRPIRWCPTS